MDELHDLQERLNTLTPREREALRGAAFETAKETAIRLNLAFRTVQNYQFEASRKLGVGSAKRAAIMLLDHERTRRVQIPPEFGTASQPAFSQAPSPSPASLPPGQDAPEPSAATPVGREVRLSPTKTLFLILAWGLGFGFIAAATALLYRIVL